MLYVLWLISGVLLAIPLILLAARARPLGQVHLLGSSLVVAAVIYTGFAVVWGDSAWLLIETLGIPAYGLFYWLAVVRRSALWLAVGWALHPIWDVALHLLGPGAQVAPDWYALVCLSFDLVVAVFIILQVRSLKVLKPGALSG